MKKAFLSLLSFLVCCVSVAQNDFIILKKNDRTVKTLFAGSAVSFATSLRYYSGRIDYIEKDSIFLLEYDIRQVPTTLGVYMLDTIATYHSKIYYRDILKIGNPKKGFDLAASGGSLFGGGVLITTVGLGTWLFTKSGDRYHASPKLVIGAAILAGAGYAILKTGTSSYSIGKKYQLNYIRTK